MLSVLLIFMRDGFLKTTTQQICVNKFDSIATQINLDTISQFDKLWKIAPTYQLMSLRGFLMNSSEGKTLVKVLKLGLRE